LRAVRAEAGDVRGRAVRRRLAQQTALAHVPLPDTAVNSGGDDA
jgi:hypothetical protein